MNNEQSVFMLEYKDCVYKLDTDSMEASVYCDKRDLGLFDVPPTVMKDFIRRIAGKKPMYIEKEYIESVIGSMSIEDDSFLEVLKRGTNE